MTLRELQAEVNRYHENLDREVLFEIKEDPNRFKIIGNSDDKSSMFRAVLLTDPVVPKTGEQNIVIHIQAKNF